MLHSRFRLFLSLALLIAATGWVRGTLADNIDIIKATYVPPLDNLFAAMDPAIKWTEMAGLPYAGTYVGPDAIMENVFSRLGSDWEGFHPKPGRFIDGGDVIVVLGSYKGIYKATGKPL